MGEAIQPVVLVGGKSRRFGRNKLREPVGSGWLVDVPIAALRAVFGGPIAGAGDCDPGVRARFERHFADVTPGAGPVSGIVAALEGAGTAVFVLAGDLARVDASVVRGVLAEAERTPGAMAVMASAGRPEPCVALYRPAALSVLRARMEAGRFSLHDAFEVDEVALAEVDPAVLVNVNEAGDLGPEARENG